MADVQRWDFTGAANHDSGGDFVEITDYLALERKVAEMESALRQERARMDATLTFALRLLHKAQPLVKRMSPGLWADIDYFLRHTAHGQPAAPAATEPPAPMPFGPNDDLIR